MKSKSLWMVLSALLCMASTRASEIAPVAREQWFQLQTPNFRVLSSGSLEHARRVVAQLEQFREAYLALAGARAVASVPIIVLAFPNDEAFRPFQPLYQGQPSGADGFFQRDYDENLIALSLETVGRGSMELICHEYAHLLMRNNDRVWPLWLVEGMADVYSTFSVQNKRVCMGLGKLRHVQFLETHSTMPLTELFQVKRNSPQYNEREQRGVFYAQSWALTHYLVMGPPPRKLQFQNFTRRLREGSAPEKAFAESFQTDFATIEAELRRYVVAGRFQEACYYLPDRPDGAGPPTARGLAPAEVHYHLGNLLLHCWRLDEAEKYFNRARELAPAAAWPYDGLGLLAVRKKDRPGAVAWFEKALERRSANFRVYYELARARLTSDRGRIGVGNLSPETIASARKALQRSIQLMPGFAPARYLLGILESEKDGAAAVRHLQSAVQLDPDAKHYSMALARLYVNRREFVFARQVLNSLLAPEVESEIRIEAQALLKTVDAATSRNE